MKQLKFTLPVLVTLLSQFTMAQTGQWKLTGNSLTGTEKIGSTNGQPLKFITSNKTRMTLTSAGNLSISSDQSSIQFALPGATPKPMMFMFPSGTSNTTRMVIAHSPNFSNFGLQYNDNADRFDFLSSGTSIFNINLGASSVGVNGNFNAVGNSSFTGNVTLSQLNTNGNNLGIKTSAPDADVHLLHATGEDSHHGLKLENVSFNHNKWTLYTANSDGALVVFFDTTHAGLFDPISGAYTSTSDARRKKDIETAPNVLKKLMQLDVKKYHFLENKTTDKKYYGMVAQDVEKIFPEVVYHRMLDNSKQDMYTLNYDAFGVIAIKAIQEQQTIIDSERAEIKELKNLVEQLTQKVSALTASSKNAIIQSKTAACYLKQNTPNPFNTSTAINYNIAENKNAVIEITSASGHLVKTYLLNQKGNGQLTIDGTGLSAGTYYYTLKVDGIKADSKQMMIVK